MQQHLILGSIEHQFKCAILISAATHKISRNTLSEIFSRLGMVDCYVPFFKRKPIPHLWELFFAHSHPTTYNKFIQQYNCWTGLLEFTSQEDDALIHQLITHQVPWKTRSTPELNSFLIPPFSHSTPAHENTNSINSTPQLKSQKISLDHLRSRMATVLAKASKIS